MLTSEQQQTQTQVSDKSAGACVHCAAFVRHRTSSKVFSEDVSWSHTHRRDVFAVEGAKGAQPAQHRPDDVIKEGADAL